MKGSLFTITEWITRFAYVNLLWIIFSIAGLIVFGFFPATVAMFTLIRQWIRGNVDAPVFKTFLYTYKKEFLSSNLFGIVIMCIGIIFYVNTQYLLLDSSEFHTIMKAPLYVAMIIMSLTVLYIIPTFVHYDIPFIHVWKNALFMMLLHPLHNILMIIGIIMMVFVMQAIPGMIVFFGGSILAYIIMGTCYHVFQRIELKKNRSENAR